MGAIKDYLITVVITSVICSIALKFIPSKNPAQPIIKSICTIILITVMISPLINTEITDVSTYIESFDAEAKTLTDDGQMQANTAAAAIILEKTEAYIMDKAAQHGVQIHVTVDISQKGSLVPDSVTIEGDVPPYTKLVLQNLIADELGIPKEAQEWI